MAVAEFLRARRGQITPGEVGLPDGGRRRVPGLRREEVAALSGLSVDYYVRLEQGRERHPSVQVLAALAQALELDDDVSQHLYRIAGYSPRLRTAARSERSRPDLLQLMAGWCDNPTLLIGRAHDVLARNALGAALWRPLTYSNNLVLNMFLDDAAPAFYQDWRAAAASTVAGFRSSAGVAGDDPRVAEIVDKLRATSPVFREIWDSNLVRGKSTEVKTFNHPDVGQVTLRMHTLDVRSVPGQQLVVYHAESGSPSAEALKLLGTISAAETVQTVPTAERN